MRKVTSYLYERPSTILHILVVPFFFFCFMLLYNPLSMTTDLLDRSGDEGVFNLTMLTCILLGVVVIFRMAFYLMRKSLDFNYLLYALWCLGEIAVFSSFASMYLVLMHQSMYTFFFTLITCLGYAILVLIFPYVILALAFVVHGLLKQKDLVPDEVNVIKFKDEKQQLKLALPSKELLYIEADENYVVIGYTDKSGLKKYTLRSSMKRIEEIVAPFGIVRCQRAFFINPAHVRLISRSTEGYIYAELDCADAPRIPISKTYYDKLSSLL